MEELRVEEAVWTLEHREGRSLTADITGWRSHTKKESGTDDHTDTHNTVMI